MIRNEIDQLIILSEWIDSMNNDQVLIMFQEIQFEFGAECLSLFTGNRRSYTWNDLDIW